ncbi:SEC-C metal-binding domain-containing protein [Lachnoclostridium sp.]|nr:SEC-C metal-binding domain-containing protein [Lachnoclostridium sp.]
MLIILDSKLLITTQKAYKLLQVQLSATFICPCGSGKKYKFCCGK